MFYGNDGKNPQSAPHTVAPWFWTNLTHGAKKIACEQLVKEHAKAWKRTWHNVLFGKHVGKSLHRYIDKDRYTYRNWLWQVLARWLIPQAPWTVFVPALLVNSSVRTTLFSDKLELETIGCGNPKTKSQFGIGKQSSNWESRKANNICDVYSSPNWGKESPEYIISILSDNMSILGRLKRLMSMYTSQIYIPHSHFFLQEW